MIKLNELEPAVKIDFNSNSNTLFIAFGSLRLEREIPPFEYGRTFAPLPVKKILVRDLCKLFYHRGLPGISNDIMGTADYLRSLINQETLDRVVIFGGSAGGYAALLYGWLLCADEVHAFAPITFLPTRRGLGWFELVARRQWGLMAANMRLKLDPRLSHQYYDLRQVLEQDNRKTSYYIYFGRGHQKDVHRSGRMADLPGIRLLQYDCASHHIDYYLQERGQWSPIFWNAI